MPGTTPNTSLSFQEDYHGCLDSLRGALTNLLSQAGVLNARPQEMAREFKLNKNLAWKISKLVHENPGHETLGFIPGPSGFRIFLEALAAHGLDASDVAKAEVTFGEFQDMVMRHAGDRSTLQLLLDSLAAQEGDADRLAESRRMAYQGNSGILGIQARVRFATFFVAPNPECPGKLDTAYLGGLLGLRRFRPDAGWILSRNTSFADDGSDFPSPKRIALDPRFAGPGPSLLGDFSSAPVPPVSIRQLPDMELYELAHGPIGNTGVGDVCFGHFTLADLPRYRDKHNHSGEFHLYLASPVETIQFDMVIHKSMGVDAPTAAMPLNFHQDLLPAVDRLPQDYLPMTEEPRLLHGARPTFSTPLVENYTGMTDLVFERLGWKPEDFQAWRLEIKFPPLPATLILSFPLQEEPEK